MNTKTIFSAALLFVGVTTTSALAAPVNGTGLVTPDVIFGSGNGNGAFTGENNNGVEVGLRGKQRYPAAGIYNYDNVDTYTFDSALLTTNPANRSVFNFEWSVNVDSGNVGGRALSDFTHFFEYDTDSGAGISFAGFDPFNVPGFFDHSLGNNATPNGGGTVSSSNAELTTNSGLFNVAQQSANLGFGYSADPDAPGSYAFRYSVLDSNGSVLLASAQINVDVLPLPLAPVPLPAALPLLLAGIGGLALLRKRRT